MTQRQFAELVGVSESTVSGLVARGVLTPGANWTEWVREYCEHLRAVAGGRIDPATADERKRLVAARAAIAELELAERQRRLVPAEEVARAARDLARAARNAIRAWPARVAPLVAAEASQSRCEEVLAREADELARQLARLPAKLVPDSRAEGDTA